MSVLTIVALILAIVGAINWGLVGLFRFDLVAWIAGGSATTAARIIYTVIGLCGVASLFAALSDCGSKEV